MKDNVYQANEMYFDKCSPSILKKMMIKINQSVKKNKNVFFQFYPQYHDII